MLALDIGFLDGLYRAQSFYRSGEAEWPPHVDRLFSALVDGWAIGLERADEARQALTWLEAQPAPEIDTPGAEPREVGDVYVPPNDASVSGKPGQAPPGAKSLAASVAVLPDQRQRQPRHFPAMRLPEGDATVTYRWRDSDPSEAEAHLPALNAIAGQVAALGHSMSLVRLYFRLEDPAEAEAAAPQERWAPDATGNVPPNWRRRIRLPYAGRLAALAAGYDAERAQRPQAGKRGGPPAGQPVWRPSEAPARTYADLMQAKPEAPQSAFGRDWLVLADDGGTAPTLGSFALGAEAMHKLLVEHSDGAEAAVRRVVTGHEPDGSPTPETHLAILPLADTGHRYASGRVLGMALVLPRERDGYRLDPVRRAVRQALGAAMATNAEPIVELGLGDGAVWRLSATEREERRALQSETYTGPARYWASVTPLVLDRFPKDRDGKRQGDIVAAACQRIGLPAPVRASFHKHSPQRGGPSAQKPSHGAARAPVRFPAKVAFARKPLAHAVLDFGEAVTGPVVLGAGRFRGLGLFRPVAAPPDPDLGVPDNERTP